MRVLPKAFQILRSLEEDHSAQRWQTLRRRVEGRIPQRYLLIISAVHGVQQVARDIYPEVSRLQAGEPARMKRDSGAARGAWFFSPPMVQKNVRGPAGCGFFGGGNV